jgi:hypothetical protein
MAARRSLSPRRCRTASGAFTSCKKRTVKKSARRAHRAGPASAHLSAEAFETLRHTLASYGAGLNDAGFITKDGRVLSVKLEVSKGRLRAVSGDRLLASFPASRLDAGVRSFVEKFWFWVPTAKGGHQAGSRAHSAGDDHLDILIEYGAVPNKREGHGYLPILWVNGRQMGHTYWPTGYDRDDAVAMARHEAAEERARYLGDYRVKVQAR